MKKLNSNKIKCLIVLLFASLILTASNAGLCENEATENLLKSLPTHRQNADIARRSVWTILALACLGTGVYFLYVSWKNAESFNDDFEIDLNNSKGNSLATPTNVNEAIRLFLRKMK